MKNLRRSLAALLVLLMCISLFPVSAFAAEDAAGSEETMEAEAVPEAAVWAEEPEEAQSTGEPAAPAEDDVFPGEETPSEQAEPAPVEGTTPAAEDDGEEEGLITAQGIDDPEDYIPGRSPEEAIEVTEFPWEGMLCDGVIMTWLKITTPPSWDGYPGEYKILFNCECETFHYWIYNAGVLNATEEERQNLAETDYCEFHDGSPSAEVGLDPEKIYYFHFWVESNGEAVPANLNLIPPIPVYAEQEELSVSCTGDCTMRVCIDNADPDDYAYSWFSGSSNDPGSRVPLANGSGNGRDYLEYKLTDVQHSGSYCCRVSDGENDYWVDFEVTALKISGDGISYSDDEYSFVCTLAPGESVEIDSVTIVDSDGNRDIESCQWYSGSSGPRYLAPIDGAISTEYEVAFDGKTRWYACEVTDADGNTYWVRLTIIYNNHFSIEPVVDDSWVVDPDSHTASVTLPANNMGITLKVKASGDDLDRNPATYYWCDYETDEHGEPIETEIDAEVLSPSRDGDTLQLGRVKKGFRCLVQAQDGHGSRDSYWFSVEVSDSPENQKFEPQQYLMLNVGESAAVSLFDETDSSLYGVVWYVTDDNGQYDCDEYGIPRTTDNGIISVNNGVVTAKAVDTAYVAARIERVSGYTYVYDDDGELVIDPVTEQPEMEPVLITSYERCRIDVVNKESALDEVTQVTLPVNKATVELYKTDYTKIAVVLETENLLSTQSILAAEEDIEIPADTGNTIAEAKFLDDETRRLFELAVVDDRTLEIVPRYETLEMVQAKASSVKGSYKSKIQVTMSDGTEFTVVDAADKPADLAITVKKSMPKLKVGKLTLNSVVTQYSIPIPNPDTGEDEPRPDTQVLSITGGVITELEWDVAAAEKAKKPAVPGWIGCDTDDGTCYAWLKKSDDTPAKENGKLYLLATVEGWAIKPSIVVSYSIVQTYPKISFKPSTVTLNASVADEAYVLGTITPLQFGEYGRFGYSISRITDDKGNLIDKDAGILTVDTEYPYSDDGPEGPYYGQDGKAYCWIHVKVGPNVEKNKSQTYKVYASYCGKEYGITVKTVPQELKLSVKQSGTISIFKYETSWREDDDTYRVGYPSQGWLTLIPTLKNVSPDAIADYHATIKKDDDEIPFCIQTWDEDSSSWLPEPDEEAWFCIQAFDDWNGRTDHIQIYVPNSLAEPGKYTLETWAVVDGIQSNVVKTPLNIKTVTSMKPPTVTTSVSGSIDVIRVNDSGIDAVMKNSLGGFYQWDYMHYYTGYDGYEMPVLIRSTDNGKTWKEEEPIDLFSDDSPFDVSSYSNAKNQPVNRLTLKSGFAEHYDLISTYKYRLKVYTGWNVRTGEPIFKLINLNIKKGSAKVTATPGTVTLYQKDRFSQAAVDLQATDDRLTPISKVQIAETEKAQSPFKLIQIGDEWSTTYALGFKNNNSAGLSAGKSMTVKLNVWFVGNNTPKPDTTVSVKVQIK